MHQKFKAEKNAFFSSEFYAKEKRQGKLMDQQGHHKRKKHEHQILLGWKDVDMDKQTSHLNWTHWANSRKQKKNLMHSLGPP